MRVRLRVLSIAVLTFACVPLGVRAQSVLQRTPNLSGGWEGSSGTVYFNFLHRFTAGDEPARKVGNVPTLLLGVGLPAAILVAANYSTNSALVAGYPNEWEFLARAVPLKQSSGLPLDVSLQAGYNNAAESADGEVQLARDLGPVRLLAVARGMSNGYAADESRFALGGGALLQLTRWLAVGGDYVQLLDAADDEDAAWSAALQLAIPLTPHTVSLQVTNTTTATVQGSSLGVGTRRYGFEFTIPFTLARYFGNRTKAAESPDAPAAAGGVNSRVRNLKFEPATLRVNAGNTVVWRNDDQVVHTVKAQDGTWESPPIDPGGTFSRTFTEPGRYEVTCGPHPFMKQIVEVR